MKKIIYLIYFFLPFYFWFLIYLKKPDLIIVFKRPSYENPLILPFGDLWKLLLVFIVMQFGNEALLRLLQNYKIFVKIQLTFIFCHLLVVIYLLVFNFF